MATIHATDGPSVDMIFAAARYATTPKWQTPLEFTIRGERVVFTWINKLTWMGERSKYLSFEVKLHGHTFDVHYDTKTRMAEFTSREVGPRAVDLWALLTQHKREVLDRVRQSL